MSAAKPLQPRRKPKQERARLTQQAILDAFVRLLLEKGYGRLTMRDIASLAGVGLGTVYEHFPGKKAIAANCIHQRFKGVALEAERVMASHAGKPVSAMIDALLDLFVALHCVRPEEWSALIFLERQVSDEAAWRTLYEHFVDIWRRALLASESANGDAAYVVHAAVYGYLYQSLMCRPEAVATPLFRQQLGTLAHAAAKGQKPGESGKMLP
ncbi:MAG TPA: TetR/AcrR family transcriptional regulator [Burkholderiaceae bacterium]